SRGGELYYTAHLASRGFVVASIDFPLTRGGAPGGPELADFHNQPGDVRFVIDQLLRLSRRRGEWLAGGVDRKRLGVTGLSLGGGTTLLVTYHRRLRHRRIRAALPVAPTGCFFGERFYRSTAGPTLLVLPRDQHRLTRVVEAAFFDATLKGSAAASCFLGEVLAAENPDARVATHAAGP